MAVEINVPRVVRVYRVLTDDVVLKVGGMEYLFLLRQEERDRALDSLGLYPTMVELRVYLNSTEDSLLSQVNCVKRLPSVVDDEFSILAPVPPGCDLKAVWKFWLELFFVDQALLIDDEVELLSYHMGNKANSRYGDEERVFSYPVAEFVLHDRPVEIDVLKNDQIVRCDVVDDFVVETLETYGMTILEFRKVLSDALRRKGEPVDLTLVDALGFCYLRLFPLVMHGYVSRWLGPDPALSSLVRMLLVFQCAGALPHETDHDLVVDEKTFMLHVQKGFDSVSSVLHDLVIRTRDGKPWIVGAEVMTFSDVSLVETGLCNVCGYVVKLHDHAARCRPVHLQQADHEYKALVRRRAWIGDDRHRLDVRELILSTPMAPEQYEICCQQFVEGKSQAAWFLGYQGDKMRAVGSSISSLAQAFEASYVGKFREEYLVYAMSILSSEFRYPQDLADMLKDDVTRLRSVDVASAVVDSVVNLKLIV